MQGIFELVFAALEDPMGIITIILLSAGMVSVWGTRRMEEN